MTELTIPFNKEIGSFSLVLLYLNLLDDFVKEPHENPSIGIILCSKSSKFDVEYSLRGIDKPVGVAGYELTHNVPEKLKDSLPSPAELEEKMIAIKMLDELYIGELSSYLNHYQELIAYHIEALGADINNPKFEESIIDEIKNEELNQNRWVLFVNNTPVSLCGFNANLPDIVQLGPVYTPLSLRNKGFARIAVYLSLKQAAAEEVKRAILFTSDNSAIRAYKALGFQEIGTYRLSLLK